MTTVNVSATTTIDAPASAVWSVLADFPNVSTWTSQVKTSVATSDATGGVGAGRHCDLSPAGSVDESIVEWVPEKKLAVSLYNVKVLPIKSSLTTFSLVELGDGRTEVTMSPVAEVKGGFLAPLIANRLRKRLPKAAAGLLGDLRVEAEKQSAAA